DNGTTPWVPEPVEGTQGRRCPGFEVQCLLTNFFLYSSMNATVFRNVFIGALFLFGALHAQESGSRNNQTVDGYKGIWFTLNQFSEYGDKYSGGLGTYTAHHMPMAIYAPAVKKTFFVYGGTTGENDKYLLCMIGS